MRSTFLQNWKRDLYIFLSVMGISAFATYLVLKSNIGDYYVWLLGQISENNIWFIVTVLIYLASVTFKQLAKPSAGMMYLTLPASTLEKVVVAILQVHVVYLVMLVVSCIVGSTAVVSWMQPSVFNMLSGDLIKILGYFLLMISTGTSVVLFASVYFRKRVLLRTVLVGLALLMLFVLIIVIINPHPYINEKHVSDAEIEAYASSILHFSIVVMIVMHLFFWFMTWLRLRETEV